MKQNFYHNLNLVLTLALLTTTYGFHDLPHMLILGIAKETLIEKDPEIIQIAEKYFDQFEEPHQKGQVQFEEHSIWSDDIKYWYKSSVKYWDTWHYIDQIYNPSNYPIDVNKQKDSNSNAQVAFNQIKETLKNKNLNGKITVMKHIFLKHLVHLVGDIHQPLHTVSFYSYQFQNGDLGGNKQMVQLSDNRKNNLHFYFDSGAFYYTFEDRIHRPFNESFIDYFEEEIARLIKLYPREELKINDEDIQFDQWVKESYMISIEQIYSQIDLTGNQKINKITDENHRKNQELCQKQIVKAGYRLANILVDFLKDEKGIYTFDKENQQLITKNKNKNNHKDGTIFAFIIALVFLIICLFGCYKNSQSHLKLKQNGNSSSHNHRHHELQNQSENL
ncbi:p1/s1 nuclease (macronuclear) [Tetrahymena thermophila SB210]|uniref:p1/s1 nuclease n=1 Tax=Tetrahymena thermophila (strain SB210) TaxID=312017 RepID=I7M158_TETTS|nr:p1/s1 nuclease [Tetrahymena thermophila SB210]EAR94988.2 p1/s1 nuclease [Tetrahymena thermophila SB210]|eukprot:XP_001015233.2 p1/s1 nuclease [Tetrahymena thermophila SB210]